MFCDKALCSGCAACYNICPKSCIEMLPDTEGFLYPEINEDKCIKCGLCKKICPSNNVQKSSVTNSPETYAAWNLNDDIRFNSSSGGIFSALAEKVLEGKGIVFGAGFNIDLSLEHKAIEDKEDLKQLRGSKYVQSMIKDSYKRVKYYLDNDKQVLFSGTPCQVDGLNYFLGKDYKKLITVDLLCHGVPSQKVFDSFVAELAKKYEDEISFIGFRDKEDAGWPNNLKIKAEFRKGKVYSEGEGKDYFLKGYLTSLFYRKSCYNCAYCKVSRVSDITIADFWGINTNKDFQHEVEKGVSLVLINSEKGKSFYKTCEDKIYSVQRQLDEAMAHNSNLHTVSRLHSKRKFFFSELNKKPFSLLVEECSRKSILKKYLQSIINPKVKNKLIKLLNNI